MLTDKGIARKMNLEHLSAAECEKILQVLQKDFELRQKEKTRLEKIEEDLKEEDTKTEVLAKKTKLNENVCIRCCQAFGLIFNRKQTCSQCHLYICKSCCSRDLEKGGFVCNVCVREHELKLKSCDWFYNNVSRRFKRFGSAKVVRTLYKQRGDSDNESDSGYDPSVYSSFKSASLQSVVRQRPSLTNVFPDRRRDDNDNNHVLEPVLPPPPQFENDLFTKPPPPVVVTPIQTSNENTRLNNNQPQNQEKETRDIYKEAFLSTKDAEEKKFETRFSGLLSELHLSLQNQSPNGVTYNTSYGGVMVNYTSRLRELLVGVSQRLELAIDSFDNNPNQSTEATSDKVRHLVSKLVENSLGESIDLTSDEAVSDLSSLSDEDSEGHKSFEDQLAQAVITKVLENHRKEAGLESLRQPLQAGVEERGHKDSVLSSSTIDQGHGDSLQNSDTDQGQAESLHEDEVDHLSPQNSFLVIDEHVTEDNTEFKGHQERTSDFTDYVIRSDSTYDKTRSESEVRGRYNQNSEKLQDSVRPSNVKQYEDCKDLLKEESGFKGLTVHQVDKEVRDDEVVGKDNKVKFQNKSSSGDFPEIVAEESFDKKYKKEDVIEEEFVQEENLTQESVDEKQPVDPVQEIQKLKSFLSDLSPRPQVRKVILEDETCDVEEPLIEPELVHREESQLDFLTKCTSINHAHEHTVSLPDFDVSDFELNSNEIDPDLLSMNLAPILEEDEEGEEEEDEEGEKVTDWRGNWIFKGNSFVSPYANMGRKHVGEELGQIYMTIPEPYQELAPRVGNREANAIFSDLSDNDDENEDNLSDEENSFYAKTSEEIARITRKGSFSQSVQTDDSDLDTSRDQWMSDSGVKGQRSKVDVSESSADDAKTKLAKKLIEELVPAENDDPKFEIPPESVTVPEGEPAKFTCRVGGTDPTDVFWYKVEDELKELEESEQFDVCRDGNRHHMTMYYPVKEDGGQYMAIAVNEKGRCCQYLVLKVKKNTQELKAPEFLKGIQDVEVIEGQAVKFRCKVKGYPQPRVVWYKDGQRLKSDSNYKLEKYGNRDYLMTIDFATMNEDAEYTVMAKNMAGEVKSSAQLIVEPEQPEETFNSIKTSFSQSSFSSSFSDDKRTRPSKEDQHISNLSRKMMTAKGNVTDVAEDMLSTANQKNAAENVRHVTSSTLNVLHSARETIDSEREDDGCLATSTPRQEGQSQIPHLKMESSDKNSKVPEISKQPQVQQKKWYNSSSYPVESFSSYVYPKTSVTSVSENDTPKDDIVSRIENMSVQSEIVLPSFSLNDNKPYDSQIEQLPVTVDSFKSSSDLNTKQKVAQQEVELQQEMAPPQEAESQQEVVLTEEVKSQSPTQKKMKVVTVVNTGPKKLVSSQFNRDFFVNATPTMSRKHWEVNTTYKSTTPPVNRDNSLEETQEQIYMTAGKVYDLEEKVGDLQTQVKDIEEQKQEELDLLEDAVALTVADVHRTEQDVSSIESSVNQIKLRALPTTIIGQTSEAELPESRTELNEDSGIKELPSVNRLKAMFSNPADESSIKRVHSITARTVPKEKLERFRKMSSSDLDESLGEQQGRTSQLTVNLAPTPKITIRDEPKQIFPETKGATFPLSVPKQTSLKTTATSQVKVQPRTQAPVTHQKKMAPQTPTSQSGEATVKKPVEKKTTPKIRSGCIAARANFWEKKIQDPQDVLEEEFPDMVVHVQE
ncbi:titin-like [Ylistrum balloti]|uniref:titin-like n=1 Tax=Ylistrum balloti TaxID=509963 RepID=UPI002905DD6F|nr:titin-like [Ylistrum balloti]